MNNSLAIKLGTIAALIVSLLIPLQMIGGVIKERQSHREHVLQDIARSSSYRQQITGPLLVVPYRKMVHEWKVNPSTQERYVEQSEVSGFLCFLPETFTLNGQMQTEIRKRGIYEARLYHATNHIGGYYTIPTQWGITEDFSDYRFDQPFLALGISDIRGIENAMKITLNGETVNFQPDSQVKLLGDGVHAQLPRDIGPQQVRLDFAFDLKLQGTGLMDITPVGRESNVKLSSDWPNPSFIGDYLPADRNVSSVGFNAHWQTSFFSTNLEEALQNCLQKSSCEEFNNRHFGVSLVDPVDQYLKSDRAIKYALLFIALTFGGFFLFEILKRLAVHAIQYSLVGMALATFYLLLLSLSEHIGFSQAYAISSTACVLLIGTYISSVLHSVLRGLGFAAGLAALYGLLFGLLSAEDYALLMGSLLLFGLLGVVMVLTRKVDWFSISRSTKASALRAE